MYTWLTKASSLLTDTEFFTQSPVLLADRQMLLQSHLNCERSDRIEGLDEFYGRYKFATNTVILYSSLHEVEIFILQLLSVTHPQPQFPKCSQLSHWKMSYLEEKLDYFFINLYLFMRGFTFSGTSWSHSLSYTLRSASWEFELATLFSQARFSDHSATTHPVSPMGAPPARTPTISTHIHAQLPKDLLVWHRTSNIYNRNWICGHVSQKICYYRGDLIFY